MKKTIYWLPRILGIAFCAFISLFALDMFGEGFGLKEAIIGFLIHLAPVYFMVAALVIAWKRELPGGIIFIAEWVAALLCFRFAVSTAVIFSPLLIIGILFLISGKYFDNKKD